MEGENEVVIFTKKKKSKRRKKKEKQGKINLKKELVWTE